MAALPGYLEWVPFAAGMWLLLRAVLALADKTARFWPPERRTGRAYGQFIWPFRVLFWGLLGLSALSMSRAEPDVATAGFWIGAILFVAGFGTAVLATLQLGWTTAFGENGPLRRDGWFRFSRNPIYVATWSGQIGWALVFPAPPILAALAVWAGFYVVAIFLEERDLLRSHRAEFETYKARTARFLGISHLIEQTEC